MKRDHIVTLRLTEQEYANLKSEADDAGQTLSAFLRNRLRPWHRVPVTHLPWGSGLLTSGGYSTVTINGTRVA